MSSEIIYILHYPYSFWKCDPLRRSWLYTIVYGHAFQLDCSTTDIRSLVQIHSVLILIVYKKKKNSYYNTRSIITYFNIRNGGTEYLQL